jgi:large subunit ribosomal protein L13
MKTYSAKPAEVERKWLLIDAEDVVLGRLAAIVADRLRGKHKPMYTPHIDCGDNVIIVNAEKVKLTGRKRTDKIYYWHTGYPGGIKNRTADKILDGQHPERVIEAAVKRMLPGGPLARQQLRKLKIYAGPEHKHEAQAPETVDVAALNPKNKRSA